MNKFAETVLHNGRDETIRHRPRTGRRRGPGPLFEPGDHIALHFGVHHRLRDGPARCAEGARQEPHHSYARACQTVAARSLQENIVRYESNVGKIEIPSPQPTPDAGPKMGQA